MKFRDFITEAKTGKVIVVYGGGFQPFHAGHMSSYEQAKRAFPSADFYVASSNDVKQRPIPFKDKQFLAQQAGVVDKFVQVVQPVNPQEILTNYNPDKDILILVRSERDPVNYTKKDGSAAYYQPFKSLKDCKPFNPKKDGHGYVFVTKKKIFSIAGQEVYSGSQVRSMYSKADDVGRRDMIKELYPKAKSPLKVKTLLDKYIGGVNEEIDLNEEVQYLISEGVHDKGIFKAVFLAGGPGSGKDYVLDNTLAGHGLTELNSDKALEFLMDKNNLDKTMPDSEAAERNVIRGKAKSITELRQRLALLGRNGLIINGTGDDVEKYAKIKARLEELGYETSMVSVVTADEVSRKRNIERGQRGGRAVPEDIRKEKWDSVTKARAEMAKMFGDNYMEFDNSEDLRTAAPEVVKQKKDEMLDIFKRIKEFVGKPPATPESKEWVANELNKKDTLPVPQEGDVVTPAHPENGAAEEAKKLGLTYFGFGRWGKNGVVTHHTVHDSLVEVTKDKPKDVNMPLVGTSSGTPKAKPVKENLDTEFEGFLTEAVTITVKADTAEEAAKAVRLLTNEGEEPDEVEEQVQVQNTFSDLTAKQLLTLGQTFGIHEAKKPEKFLTNNDGKIRVFMVRRSAAAEAHQKGGEVVKSEKGYVIKLKENVDVQSNFKSIQEAGTSSSGDTGSSRSLITEGRDCECTTSDKDTTRAEETCGCDYGTEKTTSKAKTIAEAKAKWSETKSTSKEKVKESIDAATEPGMSLSGSSKEAIGKKGRAGALPGDPIVELTGDETTLSIGAQKEDELKKVGISLSSFKAKKVV